MNEETKSIVIGKIWDRNTKNEREEYFKFDLNSNGSAEIRIPTSLKETEFYLTVDVLIVMSSPQ